jgi:hypothetical protein
MSRRASRLADFFRPRVPYRHASRLSCRLGYVPGRPFLFTVPAPVPKTDDRSLSAIVPASNTQLGRSSGDAIHGETANQRSGMMVGSQ